MRSRHLDLFSGIGGFALGLESTGAFKTAAFCEIEPFARRALAKHWPEVPCYDDVRELGADRLVADGIGRVDIVTGGFPCQDISLAGARRGLSGERSGLWSELFRIITEVRPRWAIIENVPGLRTLGADAVLADLAGAGYAAWPLVVGAVHAGAPHRRQRVWIVAHANEQGEPGLPQHEEVARSMGQYAADAMQQRHRQRERGARGVVGRDQGHKALPKGRKRWDWQRAPEPVLRRVDDGLPCGVDRRERLKALGNAVVPQIVAAIGRALVRYETN